MNNISKLIFKGRRVFYKKLIRKRVFKVEPSLENFEKVIQLHKNKNCFIHGGYHQINKFFIDKGGIEQLFKILDENYENILSPAYTLSFKEHGVFHLKHSRPDIGYFGTVFQKYAKFRSLDPIGSIWVRGIVSPEDFDLTKSFFSIRSLNAFLNSKDASTLNLGTELIKLAHLHYLEELLQLPYRKKVIYEGVVYYNDSKFILIKHETTENNEVLHLERERVEYDLLKAGVLKRYDFGPFIFRVMNNENFLNFLTEKTNKDPYYLFFEKKKK